jgi:hypothetical protein
MAPLQYSLAIALWIIGSFWVVAILAYLLDISGGIVFALLVFGILTGIAEWTMRRMVE